jgi:hypothetical protein
MNSPFFEMKWVDGYDRRRMKRLGKEKASKSKRESRGGRGVSGACSKSF